MLLGFCHRFHCFPGTDGWRQQACNSTKRVDFVKPKGAAGKQDGLQQLALTLARSCK
jgi:hypothetical protein